MTAISQTRAQATTAAIAPIARAMADSTSTRRSVV
jgi:hypothetical protein